MDRVALEIVAEREIAQHFKESMVARGVTDVFQIVVLAAGAQAALRGGRAGVVALVLAQKHVLELHHAGIGKQQGRIIAGNQARGAHDRMALGFVKLEEFIADFGRVHVLWLKIKNALQNVDYTCTRSCCVKVCRYVAVNEKSAPIRSMRSVQKPSTPHANSARARTGSFTV